MSIRMRINIKKPWKYLVGPILTAARTSKSLLNIASQTKTITMEEASKSFTGQLILAESEITHATHQLEKIFTTSTTGEDDRSFSSRTTTNNKQVRMSRKTTF